MATTRGNSVPPWKRTRRPLPFWARRAAFLVDEDDGATGAECYRRASQFTDQRLVGRRRPLPGTPPSPPIASPPRPSPRGDRGSATQFGDGGGELLGVVRGDADAGARLGEEARDRRARRRWPRARAARRRGSSTSSTARSPAPARGAAARRGGRRWRAARRGGRAGRSRPNRTLARPAARASSSARIDPSPLIRNVTSGSCRAASSSRSSDCEKPTLPAYSTTGSSPIPSSARYGVIRSPGRISLGVDEVGDRPHLVAAGRPAACRRRWRRDRRTAPSRRRRAGS